MEIKEQSRGRYSSHESVEDASLGQNPMVNLVTPSEQFENVILVKDKKD